MELALKGLKIAILALVGLYVLLYFFQERLIFFPDTVDPAYRYRLATPFEEVYVDVDDGVRLHGLLLKAVRPRGVIVYFHGNGGNVRDWGQVGEDLTRYDHDVLVVDYRGYGKSGGKIQSQEQLLADAEAVYAYARARYEETDIVLYGRSLGSGPAIRLAAGHPVKKLILETPFLSLRSIARESYPWVPAFLLKYPFPNEAWAPQVKCPVLIVHGTLDEVVPFASGEALRARFQAPVTFVPVEGAHHNNLLAYARYRDAISAFLK